MQRFGKKMRKGKNSVSIEDKDTKSCAFGENIAFHSGA